MKKNLLFIVIIIVMLASLLAVAAPAFASASCTFNSQHGWHVIGGGQDNDHWFETQEECLASLNPVVTETPEVTETTVATDEPTETNTPDPTETPVLTETPNPTEVPTESPTITPVVTETVIPTVFTTSGEERSCSWAWAQISHNIFKDVGYRHFDNPNHAYCKVWLRNKVGVEYDYYKATNP